MVVEIIIIMVIGLVFGFGVGYTIRDIELKPKKNRTWEENLDAAQ